jgi:hypothetical protein
MTRSLLACASFLLGAGTTLGALWLLGILGMTQRHDFVRDTMLENAIHARGDALRELRYGEADSAKALIESSLRVDLSILKKNRQYFDDQNLEKTLRSAQEYK